MGERPTAIICDDAPGFQTLMEALLRDAGLDVVALCENWTETEAAAEGVDAIVADLWMPEFDPDALGRIRRRAPQATIAIVTALPLESARELVADLGVDLLLSKCAPPAEVAAMVAARAGVPA